jgi:hypothetical protein
MKQLVPNAGKKTCSTPKQRFITEMKQAKHPNQNYLHTRQENDWIANDTGIEVDCVWFDNDDQKTDDTGEGRRGRT